MTGRLLFSPVEKCDILYIKGLMTDQCEDEGPVYEDNI